MFRASCAYWNHVCREILNFFDLMAFSLASFFPMGVSCKTFVTIFVTI